MQKKSSIDISLISLVIANMVPLAGVLWLGWDAFLIVLLYWMENIISGFYNVLKMVCSEILKPPSNKSKKYPVAEAFKLKNYPIILFMIHYGGFVTVHGFIIVLLFKKDISTIPRLPDWPCFLLLGEKSFKTIRYAINAMPFAVLGLFISHGVSFVQNFIFKSEYRKLRVEEIMMLPYPRCMVLHMAMFTGCFFTMKMGSPIIILVLLVIFKTIMDVTMHLSQHNDIAGR